MTTASGNGALRGYRRKPRAIYAMAGLFWALPVFVAGQLMLQAGGSWPLMRSILSSPYVLQEVALSWSAAAAVLIVSRWSFAYLVALSGYVVASRVHHWLRHPDLETPLGLFVTIVWLGVAVVLMLSSVKAPYLNPRLRWWTRPARVSLLCQATITVGGTALPMHILNLSEGGAFVRLSGPPAASPALRLGDQVTVAAEVSRSHPPDAAPWHLATTAHVVWTGRPDSPYQQGFGLKFIGLSREQQRQLKRYLRDEAKSSL